MLDAIRSYSTRQPGELAATRTAGSQDAATPPATAAARLETDGVQSTVSALARQLAASAARADERDRTSNRTELAATAKRVLGEIAGDGYYANKARHDSELPASDDPALLARAKQATAYLDDASRGGSAVRNPFAGLSPEQLSHIVYDESGAYTVNERHAAWRAAYDIEQAWRQKVVAEAMAEYNRTGKLTEFFASVLDHFKELPAIEQAQYPADYASDLEAKVARDFNYRTHQAEGASPAPKNLMEMLFAQAAGPEPDGEKDASA